MKGKMNISDIIFYGWYKILDKTIYSYGSRQGGFGPREHSFFITFLAHSINASTIFRYLLVKYFNVGLALHYSMFLAVIIFGIGYLLYFRANRANMVIDFRGSIVRLSVYVVVAMAYVAVSVYFMLIVGNYARYKLTGLTD